MRDIRPIGVFDSGIGGLTVVKELFHLLPHERIVYFGDTARVPYGTKSVETIQRYAREDTELLLSYDVKLIIVACNTVSATALEEVKRAALEKPVIGMITPAAIEAVRVSASGRIGIIGTEATVTSQAYKRALHAAASKEGRTIQIFSQACPLFVPLVEEGWTQHTATSLVAEEYLAPMRENGIDTLILGCTHYPLLEGLLQHVIGSEVRLINSGAIAAREVSRFLAEQSAPSLGQPEHLFLVSDVPRRFQQLGERFLGCGLPEVRQVVFSESWVVQPEPVSG